MPREGTSAPGQKPRADVIKVDKATDRAADEGPDDSIRRMVTSSLQLALLLLLAACSAAPWSPPPDGLPTEWRGLDVYYGTSCVVLASSSGGASEVHTLVEEVAAAIHAETGASPAPGLVLALGVEDPLPVEPVDAWFVALRDLHARATGTPPRRFDVMRLRTREDRNLEIDPALPARLLGTAVPRDDESLGLPRELRERASFVAVLPTRSCLEDVADDLLAAALDAEGASFFERALFAPFRGTAIGTMADESTKSLRAVLLAAWLPALVRDDAQFDRVCTRAGVSPAVVRGTTNEQTAEGEVGRLRAVAHDGRLHVAPPPAGDACSVYAKLPFTHFADVGHTRNERFAAAASDAGKTCVHVPVRGDPPGRDDAERLAAVLPTEGLVLMLVFGESLDQVALLLGAHAYWIGGLSAGDAMSTAIELGATSGVAAFGRSLPSEQPPPRR